MHQKTKEKRSRLGLKLKQAVQNLTVDIFGYEPQVTANILTYFTKLSKETGIPKDRLVVRIFKDRDAIRATIYNKGRVVKEIPIPELITLFTNSELKEIFYMEDKVKQGIEMFMNNFSRIHSIDVDRLHICILTGVEKIYIKGCDGAKSIKDIPLRTLIKHFIG